MALRTTARARALSPFLAMEVMERALAMERAGTPVAHLEIGEPDFPVPPAVVEACAEALRRGETRYTDSRGLPELREAIAADTQARFGVPVDPDAVVVTSGTSPAMLMVFSLLVETGDEVILASPHYPCYPNFIRFCGGTPVPVATRPEDGYALHVEDVERAVTERTRAIILASPANPTGAIQSREALAGLAALDIPVVSDEIYDGIVYDDARVTSALEVSDEAFVLDGFSKRFAMTGFRLGWCVVPEAARRAIQVMQQNLFISANRFVQHAGIAALAHGGAHLAEMRATYARRRDLLVKGLRELGFGVPRFPAGAFYVLADASPLGPIGRDSLALAYALLDEAHVGTTPGIDFGAAGEGKLRFCYAVGEDTIDSALERMARTLPALCERAR